MGLIGVIAIFVIIFSPTSGPLPLTPEERQELEQERNKLQVELNGLEFSTPESRQVLQNRIREIDTMLAN
jgi:hypothetical protein